MIHGSEGKQPNHLLGVVPFAPGSAGHAAAERFVKGQGRRRLHGCESFALFQKLLSDPPHPGCWLIQWTLFDTRALTHALHLDCPRAMGFQASQGGHR